MARKPNFGDVARAAGVSPATVSRVARGNVKVAEDMRARVRAAARELGISLDGRLAASVIVFLLSNRPMLHPVHSRILSGAESCCAARGWDMIFQSFRYDLHESPQRLKLPRILERRGLVRGMILSGTNSGNMLEALAPMGIEVAVYGNNVIGDWDPCRYNVVYSDEIGGARELTEHLVSLGHRDIWYVGVAGLPWMARAGEGYRQAMEAAGLPPRLKLMHSEERQAGYLATKALVAHHEPVSAIFAGSDPAAEGVYRALRDVGLRVPADISVCGLNDTEGAILHPPLTTLRAFSEEVGRNLAELVLERVERPELPPQQFVIPTQVVRRESWAPPRLGRKPWRGKASSFSAALPRQPKPAG